MALDKERYVLNVKQLNMYVKSLLESDLNLKSVTVRGEVSNFTRHSKSGHMYFTLKDFDSSVKTVMFASSADKLSFFPKDGMKVLVHGRVSLYERDGQYQFYADRMVQDGLGVGYLAFLELKDKLEKEGLFDSSNKKKLPEFPERIGLATSPTGAAVKDVISILSRRYPQAEIVFYPCIVQGADAATSVIKAVDYFSRNKNVDVLIITRGGGSYEDLAAFNDENLARTVYFAAIPIVSAVGHEIDFTILDFVADVRAATPSAAAELVSPDLAKVRNELEGLKYSVYRGMAAMTENQLLRLGNVKYRIDIVRTLESAQMRYDSVYNRIFTGIDRFFESENSRLRLCIEKINASNPLNILEKGYSFAYKNDKSLIKSVENIQKDEELILQVKDGEIYCAATEIKKRKKLRTGNGKT